MSWLASLAGIGLVLALLRFHALPGMGLAALGVTATVLAWIAYQYLEPLRLMRRHAFLEHAAREDGWFRRTFWQGALLRIRPALTALATAFAALVLTAGLEAWEWWVILASVPSFALLAALADRAVGRQFVPRYRLALTLRTAFWLNLLVVALALTALQVFWVEVPATAHLTLAEVAKAAWRTAADEAVVREVGWLLGADAAARAAVWHLMQRTASGGWAYIVGWSVVLAWSAAKLGAVWLLLVGVVSLVHRQQAAGWRAFGDGRTAKAFSLSLLALFALWFALARVDLGGLVERASAPLALVDPCEAVAALEARRFAGEARTALDARRVAFDAQAEALVRQHVDAAYALAEDGVERFLDWNFSLKGQYQQLLYLGAGKGVEDYVARRLDEHVQAVLAPALEELGASLATALATEVAAVHADQEARVTALLGQARCLAPSAPTLSLDDALSKSLVGVGSGAGILAAHAGSRIGGQVVGRAAVRRILGSAAARLGTRAAASGSAGAGGMLCGPLAVVCVPALAVTAWVGVDLGINAVDETLNRETLRQNILAELDAERERLIAALGEQYALLAAGMFAQIDAWQDERFNLYRDGTRPR